MLKSRAIVGGAAALIAAVGLTIGTIGTGGVASGNNTPPTTLVAASTGEAPPTLEGARATLLTDAVTDVLGGATITDITEIQDGKVDRVNITGHLDDAQFALTIYRNFKVEELDEAGLERLVLESGTAWVGATDDDLTSIYYLSSDGSGLWLGVQTYGGAKPPAVDELAASVQRLAGIESIIDTAKGAL